MRQIRRERIWTALAGREAANPTEGVSKVVHRGLPRQPQRCAGGIAVGYPCPLPFGPLARNVQNCSRQFCRHATSSGLFALSATRVCYTRMAATALALRNTSCVSPFGPACGRPTTLPAVLCAGLPLPASLRDLPAAVQKRSRRFCRHAISYSDF